MLLECHFGLPGIDSLVFWALTNDSDETHRAEIGWVWFSLYQSIKQNKYQNKSQYFWQKLSNQNLKSSPFGAWALPRKVVDMPSDTPLKKAGFPFTIGYQLQISSQLGSRTLFPLLHCHTRISSGLSCVGLVHAVTVSEFICVSILLFLEDAVSLKSFFSSGT